MGVVDLMTCFNFDDFRCLFGGGIGQWWNCDDSIQSVGT